MGARSGTERSATSSAIDGRTKILGIVGHPVAQVRAPTVWSGLFARNAVNARCLPFDVAPDDFAAFLDAARHVKNLVGLIATIPHKFAAADGATRLSARAQAIGAANVLRLEDGSWSADNFDGAGFVDGLRAEGHDVADRRSLVVGAGGAGAAIAHALAESGVSELVICDLDKRRAESLVTRLSGARSPIRVGDRDPAGFDLVVNASPAGMSDDDPLPIDPDRLGPGAVVAEAIARAVPTRLLTRVRERGLAGHPGEHMMLHEIPYMAGFFTLPEGDWSPAAAAAIHS